MRPAVATACTVALVMLVFPRPAAGQLGISCTISTSGVDFGNYDVFDSAVRTQTGTVTTQCTQNVTTRVELSPGASGTYASRTMRRSGESLNYNLFYDSNYSQVWGDGSSGTTFQSGTATVLFPTVRTVYGRIPARQDVTVGSYTDTVVATIVF